MSVRPGLFIALVVALVAPLVARAQIAAPTLHTISIATLAPAGSTWMNGLEAWNRELRRRSNRTLQFRFYPNGVQGDEAEIVRKIRSGRLDGGAMTAVGLAQIHRPTLAFQIPGMFADNAQLDRARDALRPDLDAAFESAGFKLLGWGDAGTDRVFAGRAIRTPSDLRSTHSWLWNDDLVMPAFFQEVGVSPVVFQVPEVLTALQMHQVDTVFASPIALAALQWAPFVTHMTEMPVAAEIGAIVVGREQFNALAPEQRALLEETGTQYCTLMVRNVRRDDDATIPALRARGVVMDALTPAERAQWEAVFTRTRTRLVGSLGGAAWVQRIQTAAAH